MADPIEIITPEELISYPGSGTLTLANATFYTQLVNALVTEAWAQPVDPVPVRVRAIAFEAAGRASRNPKGLLSWTRSADEGTRTERVSEAAAARVGLYLTPEEKAELRGAKRTRRSRYGTIRVAHGY